MIKPHGGELIDRVLDEDKKQNILAQKDQLKVLVLDKERTVDVRNIAHGVYSPLTGFLKKSDFSSVVKDMRLANGVVWSVPIVLDISETEKQKIKNEKQVLLVSDDSQPIAILENFEIFSYDKNSFAKNVFGTTDQNHPGVANVFKMKDYLIGGDTWLIHDQTPFSDYDLTPKETRGLFKKNGWDTVAAFQTRNVPHQGHEFLQKQALKQTDGLFIQPVIGEKKLTDFKDEFIIASYQLLIKNFFPENKVVLGILPLKMRYAGPREAVLHALIRKNFGCTHFIVGRDHAGVGDFYGPFDAQEIFNQFKPDEIGVEILKFKNVVWCHTCNSHVFENDCPDCSKNQESFSGTKIRQAILNKTPIPSYVMRPEIYNFLANSHNPLVDNKYNMHKNSNNKKGFILWFTGLSGSGKTTVADKVSEKLKQSNQHIERLDGDIVRQTLTKDLGFSKEDRDENIKRIGFVAKMLAKNGVGVLASFISPYKHQRDGVRDKVENFIEVYCKCPLKVCEKRDAKGLYAKARSGEIKNFTGVSDPYEKPENAEIILDTSSNTDENIEKCAEQVIEYLQNNNLI